MLARLLVRERTKGKRSSLLVELSSEVNGTSNSLQLLESIDRTEVSVVADLVGTVDSLQVGKRDVLEVGVAVESERATNGSQVRGRNIGHVVLVESKRSVDGSQGRHGERADVAQSHVVGPLEVGELDLHVLVVCLEVQALRDVAELHANLLEVRVVVDVKDANLHQVDTVERVELSVGDQDVLGHRNSAGEGQLLQSRKSLPPDLLDGGQGWEVER